MDNKAELIYRFTAVDYTVVAFYMGMLIAVGYIFKNLVKDSKDYFVGGNKVTWWLAGASSFMMSFSAWTFTGGAGIAYKYGLVAILFFWFNATAYLFAAIFTAPRCRQMRCITWLQIVYQRYGRATEQMFGLIQVPITFFGGAIWLTSLSLFVSIATGIPITATILITGVVITVYATLGGSWGVMATDFLQSIVMVVLTCVMAGIVIVQSGGVGNFASNLSLEQVQIVSQQHPKLWLLAYFSSIFIGFNGIQLAPRFLSVRDGKNARKSALMASALFFLGPVIWFIPPMAAAHFYPDIASVIPDYANPHECSYVLMSLRMLPSGLTALMIMVMFAATMSVMDSTMNQNAGLITMNFYKPLLRPNADDRELFMVGHIFNAVFGIMAMSLAVKISSQKTMSLFDLNVFMGSVLSLPMAVSFFMVYWVKKVPRWAAIVSVLSGFSYGLLAQHQMIVAEAQGCMFCRFMETTGISRAVNYFAVLLRIEDFDYHNRWPFQLQVFGVISVCMSVYVVSLLFWRFTNQKERENTKAFYKKMNTPVDLIKENVPSEDLRQLFVVGKLTIFMGLAVALLLLVPNNITDRLIILITSGGITAVGVLLYIAGRISRSKMETNTPISEAL